MEYKMSTCKYFIGIQKSLKASVYKKKKQVMAHVHVC